jgi:hypothetical protein
MAATAQTTGTGVQAQAEELRRRNVASQSQPSAPVTANGLEKEKSKEKVRDPVYVALGLSISWQLQGPIANHAAAFLHHRLPRRDRMDLGAADIHLLRLLYAHV